MSDVNTSLPVRTENNGDVAAKIVDATSPNQTLGIDAGGRITIKLDDGNGNVVTSQTSGAQRALDVGINVAGVQIDPRAIRTLTSTDVVTANQGTANTHAKGWFVKLTDGTNDATVKAASTAAAATDTSVVVALSPNSPLPAGTNVIGQVNQAAGSSPWITKDVANGSAVGGTASAFSLLTGGVFNTTLPTLTTGQQAALQLDSSGRLIIRQLVATSDSVTSRLQDGVGNAITSAVAGSTRPLDVELRDGSGNLYSATNPLPVQLTSGEAGTEIHDYNTSAAVAAGGVSNHDYAIPAGKTFKVTKFWASASGKMKIEVQVSTDGTTFTTRWVGFNSTANPNIPIDLGQFTLSDSGTGAKVRIIRTNKDLTPMDLYSTMSGVLV